MPDDAAPIRSSWRTSAGLSALTVAVVAAVIFGVSGLAGAADRSTASCGAGMPKLTVDGVGQATTTPNLLTVVVQVAATGPSATTALAADNAKADAAVSAFTFGGVQPKDIQTSALSLQPQYAYPKGVPTVTGYQVSNSITATLREIAKSGAVIDGVVGVAGNAVQIESVGFSSRNPGVAEDLARSRAATQAVTHAKALARAAGRSLGSVCSVTDQTTQTPAGPGDDKLQFSAAGTSAPAVPIESGSSTQSAQVSMVYALAPPSGHSRR
jgi:uncharacterized protein YggE